MKPVWISLVALAALPGAATAGTQSIEVLLHDYLHIAPETIRATVADLLDLRVTNPAENTAAHDFRLDDFDRMTPLLNPGQTVAITAVVDRAGTFEYWCSVPGHRDGGMVGTLVVTDAAGPTPHPPKAEEDASPAPAFLGAAAGLVVAARAVRRRD
ncbi:MAG TPA: cupredoxin domain-containing protein [Candidatus Thermoplasmatota archaeon]|nr:cupredoxin domain-containing protein [Candidatus Thermoplasmatota archaeon]